MDEAFRSRVHISLWYPHLSSKDTVDILQSNLKRLPLWHKSSASTDGLIKIKEEEIANFVRAEYEEHKRKHGQRRGLWDGRQNRNAVQVAACMALYEKEKDDDGLPAILTADHFRSVAETEKEFKEYLKQTRSGDDAREARSRGDRQVDFCGEEPCDRTRSMEQSCSRDMSDEQGADSGHLKPRLPWSGQESEEEEHVAGETLEIVASLSLVGEFLQAVRDGFRLYIPALSPCYFISSSHQFQPCRFLVKPSILA